QRAAVGHPRHAQDSGAADGGGRQDRGAADDVSRAVLRPPRRRRPRGGHVPGAGEGEPGGPGAAGAGFVIEMVMYACNFPVFDWLTMPTIALVSGFRIIIHPKDHLPP